MFACRLSSCPPGLFLHQGCLGFKTEYQTPEGKTEAFVVASGEVFFGGAATQEARENLMVLPVEISDARGLKLIPIIDYEEGTRP